MHLRKLHLYNYKNHDNKHFEFIEGINCIIGKNGVGKTNVLDAIHYLSHSRSYFSRSDQQVIANGTDNFAVRGAIVDDKEEFTLSCGVVSGKKKTAKKNDKPFKKISEFVGELNTVFITPTDILLVYESSEGRRRFLNAFISQFDRKYLNAVMKYNSLLDQRNSALKRQQESGVNDPVLIEVYNSKMSPLAEFIFKTRMEFLAEFNELFKGLFSKISSGKEAVEIEYQSAGQESDIKSLLTDNTLHDIRAGRTTEGIQKDDLKFMMDGEPLKSFGSQGQIKSFLISMKLAQFEYLKKKTGKIPVLLLDDIFEKIDDVRIQNLLDLVIEEGFEQVFITDAHPFRCDHYLKDLKEKMLKITLE